MFKVPSEGHRGPWRGRIGHTNCRTYTGSALFPMSRDDEIARISFGGSQNPGSVAFSSPSAKELITAH